MGFQAAAQSGEGVGKPFLVFVGLLSSQPKLTWPRMRAPEATVTAPALTSPMTAPVDSTLICAALSTLS